MSRKPPWLGFKADLQRREAKVAAVRPRDCLERGGHQVCAARMGIERNHDYH